MNVYEELQEMSLPLLEAYETDLTHDKNWIEENPGVPFMHYTRATGTHLISFSSAGSAQGSNTCSVRLTERRSYRTNWRYRIGPKAP